MLWELYQQGRINDARSTATRAESKAQSQGYRITELENKIDSLALTCQALWELLRDRSSITEEELVEKITEIDLRDGVEDGKMGGIVIPCPSCGRKLNKRHSRCMYCGNEVNKDHVFQS